LTNGKQLSAIELPVPPKPEQKAIAEALSDIDTLIVNLEKLTVKKKAIKQGAMQELLTGKRRLPGFDGEWKVCALEELCDMFSGGTPNSRIGSYYGGDIPWVSISDISVSGKYLINTEKKLTRDGLENSSARLYPAKTLLFAMYASIGKCCIANQSVSSSQAILGIYNFRNVTCQFLYYYLSFNQKTFVEMGQTGTQSNLSKKIVQKIPVFLPELNEQIAIVNILSDMDDELNTLEENLKKYQMIKQGMMSELLTGNIWLVK
jgi:type I restriction enzyme S subunit